MNWVEKKVLVTGGASFIGSHLVDLLVAKQVGMLRVVDDLSSGKRANIQRHLDNDTIEFQEANLLDSAVARKAMQGMDVVFHLAANHGGRGYIDLNQANCSQNFILDGLMIREAHLAGVEKFVFTSSGCVYPVDLQSDVQREVHLTEEMVKPPFNADGIYGWGKLMAEETLRAYHHDHGFKSVSCRLFTVYGERCLESHAVMAMIGRAFLRKNPFEVWGDGTQIRNWTYVEDTVRGLVLAAEHIDDGSAVNLGTEERITVRQAVEEIFDYTDFHPEIKYLTHMPTGPLNRVASNRLAREKIGWTPEYTFSAGLRRTIDWYFASQSEAELNANFERLLLKR